MGSSNKLQISKTATKELDHLSSRLGLRPNIVCRLAIGKSLTIPESVKAYTRLEDEESCKDTVPKEFNRFTLTGEYDEIYRILIFQHEFECEKKKISEQLYFKGYFLKHIERGLDLLYAEYVKINSPIAFLGSLVNPNADKQGKDKKKESSKEGKSQTSLDV